MSEGCRVAMAFEQVRLPGNVQRRRTDEDTLRMREFFDENDLISAEVQKVHESGELALQTRNSRYGKLQNGVLACVPSVYVRRQAQHLVTLPVGIMVILGNNGWVWVCAPPRVAGSGRQETINFSQMDVRYQKVHQDMTLGDWGQTICRCWKFRSAKLRHSCLSLLFCSVNMER